MNIKKSIELGTSNNKATVHKDRGFLALLFLIPFLLGMTPQEAEDIYRVNECSMVSQGTDKICFNCLPLQLPGGECVSPIGIDVAVHWTPEWEEPPVAPIPEPEPEPIEFPIIVVATTPDYNDGWTQNGEWMETAEGGVNLGTNTLNAPLLTYNVTVDIAGTYFIWVRGQGADASSDSINYGVNGTRKASITFLGRIWSDYTQYSNTKAVIELQAGNNAVNIWMREDGTQVSEIRITDNSSYVP